MIQTAIALLLLVVSHLQAEPIPKDKRLEFIESLWVQLKRVHPDADSLCTKRCANWRERVTNGVSGGRFPYDLNQSSDFHDTWDIYLRDAAGDTLGESWHPTENACTLHVEGDFGWLHVQAFKDSGLVDLFDRELEKTQDLRGIVLDVRKYYHSSAEALYEILGRFIEEPINGFRYHQRIAGTDQYLEHSTTVEPRGPWAFNKPVLIVYDYGWPSCGIPDILMQRSNTDSVRLPASRGRIMRKDDGWEFYVYGLQDSVGLPYGFTAWIPTSQVMHPTLNMPETQGQTIVLIDHPPTQFSIAKSTKDIWKRKQFRTLVRNYEKSEKKKRKALR